MDIYWEDLETTSDESSSCSEYDDPTFIENFSNLSIHNNKTNHTRVNGTDNKRNGKERTVEQLDQKSYEIIQKIIQGGNVGKLKVDQCKVYLRKHGLRLSGNKDTLIQRIKEHNDIVTGGGEEKYPASSFVLNCKGDACTGDIVIFEQNVYDMFNIASRCASGPPCGTRTVAGWIVKESYGAAKQQHTFTIEVLWSKGDKPLPPLHPLLIKGRNLYRLKTMRQRWEDEAEREKKLAEKHARGDIARVSREERIQNKEKWMLQRANRVTRNETSHRQTPHENLKTSNSASTTAKPDKVTNQPILKQQERKQTKYMYNTSREMDTPNQSVNFIEKPKSILGPYVPPEPIHQRQPLLGVSRSFHDGTRSYFTNVRNPGTQAQMISSNENQRFVSARSPIQGSGHNYVNGQTRIQMNGPRFSHQSHASYHGQDNFTAGRNASVQEGGYGRKQICHYYPQGKCHFGDRCRFLHE